MKQSMSKIRKNPLRYEAIDEFHADPAKYLTEAINDFLEVHPLNWAAPFSYPLFRTPVAIAFADGDSKEFKEIKENYPWTLTPREFLFGLNDYWKPEPPKKLIDGESRKTVFFPSNRPEFHPDGSVTWPEGKPPLPPWPEADPTLDPINDPKQKGPAALGFGKANLNQDHVSFISIGFPIHPKIIEAEANVKNTYLKFLGSPGYTLVSRVGAHAGVMQHIVLYVDRLLQWFGYATYVPSMGTFHDLMLQYFQKEGPTSRTPVVNEPERAWAVAAGLGTFGLHDMVITKEGSAVFLCNIITNAYIPPSPRPDKEYCLYFRDKSCRKCLENCPVGAIYESVPVAEGSGNKSIPGRLGGQCHQAAEAMAYYKENYVKEKIYAEFGPWAKGANFAFSVMGGASGPIAAYSACGQCTCGVPCSMKIPE